MNDKLIEIKEKLIDCIYEQMQDIANADTCEMAQAFDMLKDASKTIYNCTVVEAMNNGNKDTSYYHEYYYPDRDMDRYDWGRMYYTESPKLMHSTYDSSTKHVKADKSDLETYLKEVATDITSMVENATLEERQMVQKKLANLVNKINVSS